MTDPLVTPRDPKRIMEILVLIDHIWRRDPDMRLGQLLVNVVPEFDRRPFFIEDDDLLEALKDYWEKGPKVYPDSTGLDI